MGRVDRKQKYTVNALLWVALAPLFTGIFQMYYPMAPFYSLGYFLECLIVYFFVLTRDRAEAVLEFVDLSNLSERMQNVNGVSIDFVGKYHGWTRAAFIAVERDEAGKLLSVMYTTQIIDEQKKKEQEMFANSTTDALTGLLNRRAYEDDVNKLLESGQNVVYVAIDVNGLKHVNDTLGHSAGDELLAVMLRKKSVWEKRQKKWFKLLMRECTRQKQTFTQEKV